MFAGVFLYLHRRLVLLAAFFFQLRGIGLPLFIL
jgi:hypothetical protein